MSFESRRGDKQPINEPEAAPHKPAALRGQSKPLEPPTLLTEDTLSSSSKPGAVTAEQLIEDACTLAVSRAEWGKAPEFSSVVKVLIMDTEEEATLGEGWTEKFVSISDCRLWIADYHATAEGQGGRTNSRHHKFCFAGKFESLLALDSDTTICFQPCESWLTTAGFCLVVKNSVLTVKVAPSRSTSLLEVGAVAFQAQDVGARDGVSSGVDLKSSSILGFLSGVAAAKVRAR